MFIDWVVWWVRCQQGTNIISLLVSPALSRMRIMCDTHAQKQVNRCSWNIVNTMIMIVPFFMSGSLAFRNIMHVMRVGLTSLWLYYEMNRETLLNKNFSPPLGRVSSSNGISYSNAAALTASQSVNEATWIPSYRGSNSVIYFVSTM